MTVLCQRIWVPAEPPRHNVCLPLCRRLTQDYKGQALAELLYQIIIVITALIGLAVGWVQESFLPCVYSVGAGFILSCLVRQLPLFF